MRKFILLAGTALTLSAAPAMACDLELMGGPQRFNAFAAYGSYGAADAAVPISVEQEDRQLEVPSEPERAADTMDAPGEAEPVNPSGAPAPSATFR